MSRYFRDMASHPVLGIDEEREAARAVEREEIAYWVALLSLPSAARRILVGLEKSVSEASDASCNIPQIAELLRLARQCVKSGQLTAAQGPRYDELAGEIARAIRRPDSGRIWMSRARRIAKALGRARNRVESSAPACGAVPDVVDRRRQTEVPSSDDVAAYLAKVGQTFGAQKEAKDRFAKANLRLVVTIARRFDHGLVPFIDLIQEGNLGLMKAVEQFDANLEYRFSTYASWWIRHALNRGTADRGRMVRLPVHVLEAVHRVDRARSLSLARTGRQPTLEELERETGLTRRSVEAAQRVRTEAPVSLDCSVSDEDDRTPSDRWSDTSTPSPFDCVAFRDASEQVAQLLSTLPPSESRILRLRYGLDDGEERTLQEIGGEYQLSRERIRQLQNRALGKLIAVASDIAETPT